MHYKDKILYIIAGANGSGKSTLAEVLLKEKNLGFLNADEIAKEIAPNAINSVPISAGKEYFKRVYSFLQSCTTCIKRVKTRVKNGGHDVPEEDIIRRYYKSLVKFWDEYRLQVDDWTLFYNGYDYAPVVVSFGKKEKYDIINKEKQELFYNIYKIAKDEIKVND